MFKSVQSKLLDFGIVYVSCQSSSNVAIEWPILSQVSKPYLLATQTSTPSSISVDWKLLPWPRWWNWSVCWFQDQWDLGKYKSTISVQIFNDITFGFHWLRPMVLLQIHCRRMSTSVGHWRMPKWLGLHCKKKDEKSSQKFHLFRDNNQEALPEERGRISSFIPNPTNHEYSFLIPIFD